jgi:O-antigen/teichoic acid export membrane protein
MRHWFQDRQFRFLLKNSSYLATSQAVASAAGIVGVAAAGRALGLELFGTLVLIKSYLQAASGISKFQSWQLVVRYGGKALRDGETAEFEAATRFAFGLDIVSGLLGMAAAIALLPILGSVFGIPPRFIGLAMLYCLALPTMAAATPAGVLRTLHRFDLISWQSTVTPISRAVLAGSAWAAQANLEIFVAIWFATGLIGDLVLWLLAWRELRRHGLARALRPSLRTGPLREGWRFAIQVNLNTSLQAAYRPVG